ncbi:hypothetical protein, partial [Brevibacillus agri]|uniref:hypothetical protein n=1 Tax=Brevibacillus agri TaxID=51101 RepID=UPI003D1A89E6
FYATLVISRDSIIYLDGSLFCQTQVCSPYYMNPFQSSILLLLFTPIENGYMLLGQKVEEM